MIARRLGGTCHSGCHASLASWVEPAIHGCGSSAACGGGYLATPPSLASCSSATTNGIPYGSTAAYGSYDIAATCACSCSSEDACSCTIIPFDACGCFYGHLASLGCFCGFLATPSPNSSCSYQATHSCPCGKLANCGHSCSYSAAHSYTCSHLTYSHIWACSSLGWAKLLAS